MLDNFDPNLLTLDYIHKKFVKNTLKKEIIKIVVIHLCNLTRKVMKVCGLDSKKIYISTRVLKHLYDKRPAAEYEFIIRNLVQLIKYPDHIYQNKSGKRGSIAFTKLINGVLIFASIEKTKSENLEEETFITTVFEISEDYLKNCTLIWSWRDGAPSS